MRSNTVKINEILHEYKNMTLTDRTIEILCTKIDNILAPIKEK